MCLPKKNPNLTNWIYHRAALVPSTPYLVCLCLCSGTGGPPLDRNLIQWAESIKHWLILRKKPTPKIPRCFVVAQPAVWAPCRGPRREGRTTQPKEEEGSAPWFILEKESQSVPWRVRLLTPHSRVGQGSHAESTNWAVGTTHAGLSDSAGWNNLLCALPGLTAVQWSAPTWSTPDLCCLEFLPGKQNAKSLQTLGIFTGL